ncbi:MAG: HAD family hydrolase [Erysipelotrichaceae bacterium]|nr:HAD family hydrolase [Erysipelotrichaceae bacterium]
MKDYDNYIFDLYGTLIDIHTDETRPLVWQHLAERYNEYGCLWAQDDLRNAYLRMCWEEERKLRQETDYQNVEIELRRVFIRLFFEGHWRECGIPLNGKLVSQWRRLYPMAPNAVMKRFINSRFIAETAIAFRNDSTEYIRLFENTRRTLTELQKTKRVFLLSNAQACFTDHEIDKFDLGKYFEKIYLSSNEQVKKPEKQFIMNLMNENMLDPQKTVMVGNDIISDMGSARAVGIDGILLNTFGFDAKRLQEDFAQVYGQEKPNVEVIEDGDIGKLIAA